MKAEGIPYVFGLPGDPRHLYDALAAAEPDGGPRPIGVRYETSGAFMAMAYTRVSGTLAACFGCPGPGIANLVARHPRSLFRLHADARSSASAPAARPTGWAPSRRPTTSACSARSRSGRRRSRLPERIPWTLRRAVSARHAPASRVQSTSSCRPTSVWARRRSPPTSPRSADRRPRPNPAAIAAAADLIAGANRPLLITGGGAMLSRRRRGGGALSPTRSASRSRRRRPGGARSPRPTRSSVGLVGLYRTTFPRQIYEEADLIITVGSRMEEFQGGFLPFPAEAKIDPDRHRAVRDRAQLATGRRDPGRRAAGGRSAARRARRARRPTERGAGGRRDQARARGGDRRRPPRRRGGDGERRRCRSRASRSSPRSTASSATTRSWSRRTAARICGPTTGPTTRCSTPAAACRRPSRPRWATA